MFQQLSRFTISQQPPLSAPLRLMIPASRSFLICFSTPRDDISISIAISVADIVGLFFIKSSILSELFLFLSELFEAVSELSQHPSCTRILTNLLEELIQCILNSANELVVNEVYVLQNGKCTNFANDSGKQTIRYFRVVPDDQELVCKL